MIRLKKRKSLACVFLFLFFPSVCLGGEAWRMGTIHFDDGSKEVAECRFRSPTNTFMMNNDRVKVPSADIKALEILWVEAGKCSKSYTLSGCKYWYAKIGARIETTAGVVAQVETTSQRFRNSSSTEIRSINPLTKQSEITLHTWTGVGKDGNYHSKVDRRRIIKLVFD